MERDRLAADLEFVKALALEAAAVALTRAGQVTPQEKANLSFVTDLDHDLERLIRDRLAERVPRRPLTGEEYAAAAARGRGAGRSTRSTAPATSSTACRSGPSASACSTRASRCWA